MNPKGHSTAAPLIVLIDPAGPSDPRVAQLAEQAQPLGRVVHCTDEAAAEAVLQPREPNAVAVAVLGPNLGSPARCGRWLGRKGLADQLLFAVLPSQEPALRRTLSYSAINLPWELLAADDPRLPDTVRTMIGSARQRQKFRTTIDRMNLRLQRQSVDPSMYRSLVVSNRYLDSILQHTSDAVFSLDAEAIVLTWNRGGEFLFGLPERNAVGRSLYSLATWPREEVAARFAEALGGRSQHFETEARLQHGTLAVDMILTPVQDDAGATMGVAAIVRDISDRRRAEQERERVLEAERAARAELEHLARMKDEFLAVLSHELKTPLSAVLGYAAVLQRAARDKPVFANAADGIARNARAQSRLIDELLDMSAINAGKLRLELQPLDAATIVRGAVESMRPSAAARGIAIDLETDRGAHCVRADPDRLLQVVSNLLTNAVKFSHEGARVRVTVRAGDGGVEIVVADKGVGIAPAFLPHVFDRFAQADTSTSRRHGGLGLGLSIVRQLVELQGGNVRAESEGEGRGARFTVSLPKHDSAQAASPAQRMGARAASELEGMNVLIVDDEPDAREVLRLLLSTLGASSRVAGDADEGLRLLQRERFDLLLSDISMPGRNGYELMREVRASPEARLRDLPAIAVTAFGRAEDRRAALDAGYDEHVPKPVELPALLNAIGHAVGREA